jgi:hypothetical protein
MQYLLQALAASVDCSSHALSAVRFYAVLGWQSFTNISVDPGRAIVSGQKLTTSLFTEVNGPVTRLEGCETGSSCLLNSQGWLWRLWSRPDQAGVAGVCHHCAYTG